MKMSPKHWRALIITAYIVAMFYFSVMGLTYPNRNWDMVCYVGSVTAWKEKTPDAIYTSAMDALKQTVPDWLYQQVIENPLSASPEVYVQQLPFCQVKPLYNASLWLLHAATGMQLTTASWVTSANCFAALSFLLFYWRPRYLAVSGWLLFVLGLSLLGEEPMNELARLSTPDALATVLFVAAAFAWVTRHSFGFFCLLGMLSMLARPDMLIPVGAFTAYFATLAPKEHKMPFLPSGIYALALLAITFAVKHFAQPASYTYGLFFIYSFINKNPNPATMSDQLTWDMYWQIFSASAIEFLTVPRIMAMLALTAAGLFGYYMKPARGNRLWRDLLLVTWGALAVRFVLWPASHEYRFYYGYCLIILMAAGELVSPYMGTLWNMLQAHRRRIQEQP